MLGPPTPYPAAATTSCALRCQQAHTTALHAHGYSPLPWHTAHQGRLKTRRCQFHQGDRHAQSLGHGRGNPVLKRRPSRPSRGSLQMVLVWPAVEGCRPTIDSRRPPTAEGAGRGPPSPASCPMGFPWLRGLGSQMRKGPCEALLHGLSSISQIFGPQLPGATIQCQPSMETFPVVHFPCSPRPRQPRATYWTPGLLRLVLPRTAGKKLAPSPPGL